MKDVRREADINFLCLDLLKSLAHDRKILGVVDFAAELILNVVRNDVCIVRNFIECVLGITARVLRFAESADGIKPCLPVFLCETVEGLGCERVIEELDADLLDLAVPDDCLEVLFGKRNGGRDRHCRLLCEDAVEDRILENKIAVHHYDVVSPEEIFCHIDRIDVIRLVIYRVIDELDVEIEIK